MVQQMGRGFRYQLSPHKIRIRWTPPSFFWMKKICWVEAFVLNHGVYLFSCASVHVGTIAMGQSIIINGIIGPWGSEWMNLIVLASHEADTTWTLECGMRLKGVTWPLHLLSWAADSETCVPLPRASLSAGPNSNSGTQGTLWCWTLQSNCLFIGQPGNISQTQLWAGAPHQARKMRVHRGVSLIWHTQPQTVHQGRLTIAHWLCLAKGPLDSSLLTRCKG